MKTTDLCDAHGAAVRVSEPLWRDFGGVVEFAGLAHCLRVLDDNSFVRRALERPGEGRVLVVDGAGSRRCALLGGNLAALGADNGWAGVVVHGCVRDSAELAASRIGIKALATHPRRSDKRDAGEENVVLGFAGITIRPGEWLCGDEDGLVVSATALSLD